MDGGDLIGVPAIVQSNSEVEQNEQTIMNRQWLDENGFESRVKGRGFLIRGWATQVLILSHRAAANEINFWLLEVTQWQKAISYAPTTDNVG
ncbi:putative flavonol 3-O-glucosyltransferase [Helianthus annuus]|nr:putative flavonol 3-O-glucosyltransferase [Helianthus annuus]